MNAKILQTATLYTFFSIVNQCFGLMLHLLMMRNFSVTSYGSYAIIFEGAAFTQLVLNGAYRNFYLQKIRNGTSENINALINFQALNGSLIILFFSSIICFFYKLDLTISLMLIFSNVLVSMLLPLQAYWLVENKRQLLIIKDMSTAIFSLVVVFICVKLLSLDVKEIAIFQMASNMIISLVFAFLFARSFFTLSNLKGVLKYGIKYEKSLFTFFVIFLVNVIHNKYGGIFLRHYSTEIQLALYLAAFKFINPIFFIQTSLISAFMPSFIKDVNFKFDGKVFVTFALPGFLVAVVLYTLFPFILSFLGINQYLQSYELIKISCIFIVIVFVYGAMSNFISVTGGQSFILKTNIIAFIIMLLMTFMLKGHGEDNINIISTFVFAECLICISYYYYLCKKNTIVSPFFIILPLLGVACDILFYINFNM